MFNISITTEIDVPADVAFAYVADFANNPAWQSGIKSTEWTSPRPIQAGSTYNQQIDYHDVVTGYRIAGFEPGRSITTASQVGATIPTVVTRTVQALENSRCRVTVDLLGRPRGWRRLAQPLLKRLIRKSVKADYGRLKQSLEDVVADS